MCAELTHCKYHPDSVLYPGMGIEKGWHGAGIYPCCNQRVLRFDPTGMPKVWTHRYTHVTPPFVIMLFCATIKYKRINKYMF